MDHLEEGHHYHHHHDKEENEELDKEEEMYIEPTRVVGVSTSPPIQEDEFWDHKPTKDEIWEVRFH